MPQLVPGQVIHEKPVRALAEQQLTEKRAQYREILITNLANWIPNKPGMIVRAALYPHILAQMGKAVRIAADADFRGSHQISLGNNIFIGRNTWLNAKVPGGRIQIEDNSYILDAVNLLCQNDYGTIILRENVSVDRGVDIKAIGGRVEIQPGTYIGPYVCMAGPGNITIGKDCLIGSHTSIYANNHIFSDLTTPIRLQDTTQKGIVIEDDCWLGTGVKVLDGVTIGRGSVIGAGAVVTKNIPPLAIAVGVPAQVIRYRDSETKQTEHAVPLTANSLGPDSQSLPPYPQMACQLT
jgi:acetyltransferase-like isoleucine patch superfamily enzyme